MAKSTGIHKAPFDLGAAIMQFVRAGADDHSGGRPFWMRLWLLTTVGYFIVFAIVTPIMGPAYADLLEINWQTMQSLNSGTVQDPTAMLDVFKRLWLPYLGLMLGIWLIAVMAESALHRKVLRGEGDGFFLFRLGGDEGRVALAQIGVWAMWFLAYFGGAIVLAIISGIFGIISPILAAIAMVILFIALICLIIYVPVRLAPAAALSVNDKAARLFGARPVSKGRFWPMFGSFLVVFIAGYVLIYIVMIIAGIALVGSMDLGTAMSGLGSENPRAVLDLVGERLKSPLGIAIAVIGGLAYCAAFALFSLCMVGISTYAVKLWRGEESPADVFS